MTYISKNIVNFLKKANYFILNFLNRFLKKDNNKIFFYDGTFNKSNCWALLSHLIENEYNKDYKIIYYTNKPIQPKIFQNNKNIIFESNILFGLIHQLTSKYVFWEQGRYKFTCKPFNGQIVMNLWHGMPLKSIGYLNDNQPSHLYSDDFSYILVTSNYFKKIMRKAFGHTIKQEYCGGYPRNDYLKTDRDVYGLIENEVQRNSTTVLWMPTYRKSYKQASHEPEFYFPVLHNDNIDQFDEFLDNNNINLYIKPHPIQNSLTMFRREYKRIKIINDNFLNKLNIHLYELVGKCDILLTDYSSVYFDFLLTGKPIGFVFNDYEEYKKNRGFSIKKPKSIMAGEIASNMKELKNMLKMIINGKDQHLEQRKTMNELFNTYKVNHCNRLIDFLGINKK